MFKKNDPLVESVRKIMEENELRRRVEARLCEELGIASRKALPFEHHANYDALLEQRIQEATDPSKYSEKQKKLAAVGNKAGIGGDHRKIDAPDLAGARKGHASHIEEEQLDERNKENKAKKDEYVRSLGDKSEKPNPYKFKKSVSDLMQGRKELQQMEEEQLDETSDEKISKYKDASKRNVGGLVLIAGLRRFVGVNPSDKDSDTIRRRVQGLTRSARKSGNSDDAYDAAAMRHNLGVSEPRRGKGKLKLKEEDKSSSDPDFAAPADPRAPKYKDEIQYKDDSKSTMPKNPPMPPRRPANLEEKAVSKAQQRFFGLVRGIQKGKAEGSEKAEKAAKEMTTKEVKKYAKTKHKGLPEKKDSEND